MRNTTLLVASAALMALPSLAYKDSSPLLLWSSKPNAAVKEASEVITSGVISAQDVYATISSLGCEWDTIVVAHTPDLHQSHIEGLTLPSNTADLHIPYLIRPTSNLLDAGVEEWARLCGAEVRESMDNLEGKSIVKLQVEKNEDISKLSSKLSDSHIIIYTGTREPPNENENENQKRQERPFPTRTSSSTSSVSATSTVTESNSESETTSSTSTSTSSESSSSSESESTLYQQPSSTTTTTSPSHSGGSHNTTLPTDGPLLSRVQILTTPLITALLISFGIFIPIIMFGVYALVGIQVPPRMMEIGKGLVIGKDRKDQ